MTNRPLPGLEPGFVRFEIERMEDGYYDVHVWCAQGRRYISRSGYELFEGLTLEEAHDVVCAML